MCITFDARGRAILTVLSNGRPRRRSLRWSSPPSWRVRRSFEVTLGRSGAPFTTWQGRFRYIQNGWTSPYEATEQTCHGPDPCDRRHDHVYSDCHFHDGTNRFGLLTIGHGHSRARPDATADGLRRPLCLETRMESTEMDERYVGWVLHADDRVALLARFPPVFPNVIADHITLCRQDAPEAAALAERRGLIVSRVLDPTGIEAFVVEINGTTDRPGGGTYHLTWSIDIHAGRKAFHSNAAIAKLNWRAVHPVVEVALQVGSWPASRYP